MFRDISFGQYYPTNSVIHKLDARTKLVLTILWVMTIFFIKSYFGFMLGIVFLTGTILVSKLPFMSVLKSIKAVIFIVFFTAILNLFFVRDGEVLVAWKFIIITKTGLNTSIMMALRLVLLVMGASLLSLTTTPVALADGVESLIGPLKKIKVPVRDIALIMSIALRFVPTLFEETNKIVNAQKARGASFDTGGLFARAKALLPVLIPLFVNSFRRADELAFAMDARCYNATENRTRYKTPKLKACDFIAFLVMIVFFSAILVHRYQFDSIMDSIIFGGLL